MWMDHIQALEHLIKQNCVLTKSRRCAVQTCANLHWLADQQLIMIDMYMCYTCHKGAVHYYHPELPQGDFQHLHYSSWTAFLFEHTAVQFHSFMCNVLIQLQEDTMKTVVTSSEGLKQLVHLQIHSHHYCTRCYLHIHRTSSWDFLPECPVTLGSSALIRRIWKYIWKYIIHLFPYHIVCILYIYVNNTYQ